MERHEGTEETYDGKTAKRRNATRKEAREKDGFSKTLHVISFDDCLVVLRLLMLDTHLFLLKSWD